MGPRILDPETIPYTDLHRSVAERKGRREIRKPARFRDEVPEPPTILLHSETTGSELVTTIVASSERAIIPPTRPGLGDHQVRRGLTSPPNTFGLFRKYHSEYFPSHDPEEEITSADLRDTDDTSTPSNVTVIPSSGSPSAEPMFGPYPNESSFLLGEWFWNGGVQKSKRSFKDLIDIISSPNFHPADVGETNWDLVDKQLGDSNGEWTDIEDATWTRTPVEIQVPFHSRSSKPGTQTYTLPDFFHRSIISIMREKLSDEQEFRHFHLEPFELHWQCGQVAEPKRVYGELYTSPEFVKAHEKLQASPPEPSCSLPRYVAALMFASDSTQLTAYGEAKIWPLYMFFGNDSKYRRCKPSLHLCNHVAYFQKVCTSKLTS